MIADNTLLMSQLVIQPATAPRSGNLPGIADSRSR